MWLAIDIGNTNIVFGIHELDSWINIWRIGTDKQKTTDEYEVIYRSLFESENVNVGYSKSGYKQRCSILE